MAPHSVALRALGIAAIVYAGVLMVEPAMALRAVWAFGPVYESIVKQDMEATGQLDAAGAGTTAAQVAGAARWHILRGGWEQVAPAMVLAAVGLLGGVLLVLRRRAGPWIVLLFALWPAATWAIGRIHDAWTGRAPESAVELSRKVIHFGLLGRSAVVDARSYATAVQIAFAVVTVAIVAWAFAAGRSITRTSRGTPPAAP